MSLWASVKEWCTRESLPRLVQRMDPKYVQPRTSDATAEADSSYLRIKMVEMVLAYDRKWFKDQQASVHALVKLRYANYTIDIPSVLAPNPTMYAPGASVFANSTVLPLTPFRGGEIDLEVALIAVPGDDRLAGGIKALSNVASLIGTPLSAALALAGKVKESAELLVGAGSQVHLAYRNTFNATPGATQLRDGYIVVANVQPGAFGQMALVVDNDQLRLWDGIQTRPITGVDYMLLRIEVLPQRDDLASFGDIESHRNGTITAFMTADTAEKKADAERSYRTALAAIRVHPELINSDRRRLTKELQVELEPYRSTTEAVRLAPPKRRRWSQFISELPEEIDNQPLSEAEFLSPS